MSSLDLLGRPLRNLRISVTDRCNLRCQYCMPEAEYAWLSKSLILRFEEISFLVSIFTDAGVDKVRLTGGEPLLRRGLPELVRMLAANTSIRDLALTTNGLLLPEQAQSLHDAGLHRLTVSLDTLHRDCFEALTRRDGLDQVLAGIESARAAGFAGTKIDAVILRGLNDGELADLIEFGKQREIEVRFIEYMDVGGATKWSPDQVVSRAEILSRLEDRYGRIEPVAEASSAPAERFRLPDGTVFGVISSTTAPFCRSCDRSRLTADGMWLLCLYARVGTDLRSLLRTGASRERIFDLIARVWTARTDRGAEERLETAHRSSLVGLGELRRDPHLEMHTRGG